ncbi:MAG TPA: HAD family hydrolase [Candidatus Limnocylindrales bacterium]
MSLGGAREGRPVVFLDKDGTLVEDVPYNVDPALVRLAPGAAAGLTRLHGAGFALAVVSNQSGIARGYFPESALDGIRERLTALLAAHGIPLEGFFHCPHHPDGVNEYAVVCDCRKPAPGLVLRAAAELGADLTRSWLVGDILDDVEAGRRAGCRTILVDRGHETEWRRTAERRPEAIARDLAEAAEIILASPRRPARPEPAARSEPRTTPRRGRRTQEPSAPLATGGAR